MTTWPSGLTITPLPAAGNRTGAPLLETAGHDGDVDERRVDLVARELDGLVEGVLLGVARDGRGEGQKEGEGDPFHRQVGRQAYHSGVRKGGGTGGPVPRDPLHQRAGTFSRAR